MDQVTKLFVDLVKIPSPSGKELEVGEFIKKYLIKIKVTADFDSSGTLNDSNSGNLIAKLQGDPALPTILFAAHMDTVETGKKLINPQVKDGVITSERNTILGADDKAAVASLLETLKEVREWKKRPTIIAAFTSREEQGKMGASVLNLPEKIDYCFNLDGPNELGDFVYQTLGEVPFEIVIKGKAAHAAVEPEKGVNAIKTAAKFISLLPIGKDEKGTVLNIGKIAGGTANNVVPDEVFLTGQARAFEQKELNQMLDKISHLLKKTCNSSGCTFEFIKKPEEGAPPSSLNKDHKMVGIAQRATESLGKKFRLIQGSYTSDSNFLGVKYPTLTSCRGSKLPHSFEESVTVENLNDSKALLLELIKQVSITS